MFAGVRALKIIFLKLFFYARRRCAVVWRGYAKRFPELVKYGAQFFRAIVKCNHNPKFAGLGV
jgi:hypothetical protein